MKNLEKLYDTIVERGNSQSEESYTAKLFAGGMNLMGKKIGEETAEMIVEACRLQAERNNISVSKEAFIHEVADTLYHYLVLVAYFGVSLEDIEAELEKRSGVSGIQEKKNRKFIK